MKGIKHTPGPWRVERITPGDKDIFIRSVEERDWDRVDCTVSRDDCDTKVAEANARLISAAPELLDACKTCAHVMHGLKLAGKETHEHYVMMAKRLLDEFLTPAISKAEGQ